MEPVSISLIYDHKNKKTKISNVVWKNKIYKIYTQGLHHTFSRGKNPIHVFSIAAETISFKIEFDATALTWNLLETYDITDS